MRQGFLASRSANTAKFDALLLAPIEGRWDRVQQFPRCTAAHAGICRRDSITNMG
ncbi:ATP-dependent DNA-helicase RecG [Sesbania bispinosa]|nr:ATP-dependent DNA-helicase RecG [Sesbania bispinosa]